MSSTWTRRINPLYVDAKLWTIQPAASILMSHLETFNAFPPRQAPANFNPEAMVSKALKAASASVDG